MSYNLLKGKRGIIFGALDEKSIAWKVAVRAVEEGATITLSNTPMAIRMGDIMMLRGRITHVGRNTVNLCCEALVKDKLCATADAIFYKVG